MPSKFGMQMMLGSLCQLRKWWDKLCLSSGLFRYNVNAAKCWLVVKDDLLQEARHSFVNTSVQVTSTGHLYLGAALRFTYQLMYPTAC